MAYSRVRIAICLRPGVKHAVLCLLYLDFPVSWMLAISTARLEDVMQIPPILTPSYKVHTKSGILHNVGGPHTGSARHISDTW